MAALPKPHLSITLPRSFQFHYADGENPQTPAAQPALSSPAEPSSSRRQTFKLRRRRADNMHDQAHTLDAEPLPTIEMTEAGDSIMTSRSVSPLLTPGYLAPRPSYLRLISPPRTPASQLTTYSTDTSQSNEWSMIHDVRGNPIERPLSACSTFSDSSAASFGSSNASNSLGGSCTSPESDAADPFTYYDVKSGPSPAHGLAPAISSITNTPAAKRVKTSRHPKWTSEMDNHLWITYMGYVQDPRVTPFKMLAGTPPPLGVCHRVAREAKRTWRGTRVPQPSDRLLLRISLQRSGLPDLARAQCSQDGADNSRATSSSSSSKWPRSEAATRRRLRDLCKRKPSLSAHYMRLLRTRSPSPFESSSPRCRTEETTDAFSSRDLNVSLTTVTAPSMQAGAPLARLHESTDLPAAIPAPASQRPADWFARIGRSQARAQAHQKSQSLQLGLGLNSSWSGPNTGFERGSILASPFDSDAGRGDVQQNTMMTTATATTQSLGRAQLKGASLNSPLEVGAPMPTVRSLKRRFGVDPEAAENQPSLKDLFATPVYRPVRNRGFSLGDMMTPGMTNMTNMTDITPQSSFQDHPMGEAPEVRPSTSYLATPQSQLPPRLGSPFTAGPNKRFNTFPRRFTPLESEVEVAFDEKLCRLATKAQQTK